MNLPVTIRCYCPNTTTTSNAIVVGIGELDLFFSYETLVAFSLPGVGRIVHENIWSATTGKHLNAIDKKRGDRVGAEKFNALLQSTLEKVGLTKIPTASDLIDYSSSAEV